MILFRDGGGLLDDGLVALPLPQVGSHLTTAATNGATSSTSAIVRALAAHVSPSRAASGLVRTDEVLEEAVLERVCGLPWNVNVEDLSRLRGDHAGEF